MTPEEIRSHLARELTPEERCHYSDDGSAVAEGAASRPWLDRRHVASTEMVEPSPTRSEGGFVLGDGGGSGY